MRNNSTQKEAMRKGKTKSVVHLFYTSTRAIHLGHLDKFLTAQLIQQEHVGKDQQHTVNVDYKSTS